MPELPSLNIALRGHVRESLFDSRLRDLIGKIGDSFKTKIFAHTWNVQQNSLSWRRVEDVPNPISEESVRSYFGGFEVNSVEIGEDWRISHHGNTEGKVGRTNCPVRGWKNMYYGKIRVCSLVSQCEPPESVTIQMRFDILSNPYSPREEEILNFVKREFDPLEKDPGEEKIRFLRMHCFVGVDNLYMARICDMSRFVSYMYYDMDRILVVHRRTINQEHIAFHERRSFWNYEPPRKPVD